MSITGKLILLAIMFFCHIADDYYLQGILSQMKQREWWRRNAPGKLYRNDYMMALFEHAFSWSFVMSMPLLVAAMCAGNEKLMRLLLVSYIVNTIIHAYAGHKNVYGLHISELHVFDHSKSLNEYGMIRPPQSWCYVFSDDNGRIL